MNDKEGINILPVVGGNGTEFVHTLIYNYERYRLYRKR